MERWILLLSLLIPSTLLAQQDCEPPHKSYQVGEVLDYDIKYNWGAIWLTAGKVSFSVKEEKIRGRECYHFIGQGRSLPFYDHIFKVRDRYESYALKDGLIPLRFKRDVKEGRTRYYEDYVFDPLDNTVIAASTNITRKDEKEFTMDTLSIPSCALDVITAIYYCRGLDFANYDPNDTIPVTLVLDEKVHETYVVYDGKKEFKRRNGEKVQCIQFRPQLIEGSLFKEGDEMRVLVSDDARRMPLYVNAEIIVGTVKVYLDTFSGTIDP